MFTFSLLKTDERQMVAVIIPGSDPLAADDTHPGFKAIVGLCAQESAEAGSVDTDELTKLFDVQTAIAAKFERLSERVTVENDTVCLDGNPVETGLSKQIMRFMHEGEDFDPLVNFMEKIAANPNEHSRAQAWDWLNNHDFTLFADGDVLGYKGVYADGNGGYRSGSSGHAFVNDEEIQGLIPNAVGDVIHMPRDEVKHDPAAACHAGLHIGTYNYARSYARGAMLKVKVSPRDIVSVPTDASGEKIRVCRYEVVEIIDAPVTTALDSKFRDDDSRGHGIDLWFGDDDDEVEADEFTAGDRVVDTDGDQGTVVEDPDSETGLSVEYDDGAYGLTPIDEDDTFFSLIS